MKMDSNKRFISDITVDLFDFLGTNFHGLMDFSPIFVVTLYCGFSNFGIQVYIKYALF